MDLVVIVMSGIHSDDIQTANMTDEGAAVDKPEAFFSGDLWFHKAVVIPLVFGNCRY